MEFLEFLKMLFFVLAALAAARGLEILWKRNEKTWSVLSWKGNVKVDLKTYINDHMKEALEAYVFYSWHFLMKVMKEVYACIILVKVWEMYWNLPLETSADFEREVMKVILLKASSLALQFYFLGVRLYPIVEAILVKLGYMEKRSSEKTAKERSRHLAATVAEYNGDVGSKIWLERHLRSMFEHVMEVIGVQLSPEPLQLNGGVQSPDAGWLGYWRLICTEVLLRHCRDVVARKLGAISVGLADGGEKLRQAAETKTAEDKEFMKQDRLMKDIFKSNPATVIAAVQEFDSKPWGEDEARFLKNLSLRGLQFWVPLCSEQEWIHCSWNSDHCRTAQELVMKSQLVERKAELETMIRFALTWAGEKRVEMKEFLMEDMPPLVKDWGRQAEGQGTGATVRNMSLVR